jgi:ligand-binding SRPBCC domain-containing protein
MIVDKAQERDEPIHVKGSAYLESLRLAGVGWMSGRDPGKPPSRWQVVETSSRLAASPQAVYDFCLREENFAALMPDRIQPLWTSSEVGELHGTYLFRWYMKNVVPVRWGAFIDQAEPGVYFSDLQVRGMFTYFHHTHTCAAEGDGTRYTDRVVFATRLGGLVDGLVVRRELARVFAQRHRRMADLIDDGGGSS